MDKKKYEIYTSLKKQYNGNNIARIVDILIDEDTNSLSMKYDIIRLEIDKNAIWNEAKVI